MTVHLSFSYTPPVANSTGPYGFEEGFLAAEITGSWDVDSSGARSGSYALRAPYMAAAGTASTKLAYNETHTQISFWTYGTVDFYIDDIYYNTYGGSYWQSRVIIVPEGTHTYRWSVTRTSDGRSSTWIDDISF